MLRENTWKTWIMGPPYITECCIIYLNIIHHILLHFVAPAHKWASSIFPFVVVETSEGLVPDPLHPAFFSAERLGFRCVAMFEEARSRHLFCLADWWPFELEGSEARMSLWPFIGCNCGANEIVSPPGSPRRGRGSAQTLLARGRESSAPRSKGSPRGTVEVVQVATTDEMSDTQQISSSSLLDTKPLTSRSVELDNTGSRSVKNSVRWELEVQGMSPKSQKSQKSLEKAERTQKKRKTLHTWFLGQAVDSLYQSMPSPKISNLWHACVTCAWV